MGGDWVSGGQWGRAVCGEVCGRWEDWGWFWLLVLILWLRVMGYELKVMVYGYGFCFFSKCHWDGEDMTYSINNLNGVNGLVLIEQNQ